MIGGEMLILVSARLRVDAGRAGRRHYTSIRTLPPDLDVVLPPMGGDPRSARAQQVQDQARDVELARRITDGLVNART